MRALNLEAGIIKMSRFSYNLILRKEFEVTRKGQQNL